MNVRVLMVCVLTVCSIASAQVRKDRAIGRQWFFGYVANVPKQFIGLEFGQFGEGLLGFHSELRLANVNFPDNVKPVGERTAEYVPTASTYENLLTLNGALNYGFAEHAVGYLGIGVTATLQAQEYLSFRRGDRQWFESDNRVSLNILVGVFYRIGQIYLQGGFETAPAGLVVGVGF